MDMFVGELVATIGPNSPLLLVWRPGICPENGWGAPEETGGVTRIQFLGTMKQRRKMRAKGRCVQQPDGIRFNIKPCVTEPGGRKTVSSFPFIAFALVLCGGRGNASVTIDDFWHIR